MSDSTICPECSQWVDCDGFGNPWNHTCEGVKTEEQVLRQQLAQLHRQYRERAQPIIDRLSRIESAKPIVLTIRTDMIDSDVLEMLKRKGAIDV